MISRRKFVGSSILTTLVIGAGRLPVPGRVPAGTKQPGGPVRPLVVSTWEHGLAANEAAWEVITQGGRALDAVEKGVKVPEGDPAVKTVGYGGLPDASGQVTLDACIMDETGNCGSVAYLKGIRHPVSVARMVMERTPHVMLVGQGALDFALENGFEEEDLLTPEARMEWDQWRKANKEGEGSGHDTIGMLAIDIKGNLAGACTTSGLAYKKPGRVGDSPIIGAGLYLDNDVGGAVATGNGELVMKTLGTFLVVELMRKGMTPDEACREAVLRIIDKCDPSVGEQVGFLALSVSGMTGACSIRPGFTWARCNGKENRLCDAVYIAGNKSDAK